MFSGILLFIDMNICWNNNLKSISNTILVLTLLQFSSTLATLVTDVKETQENIVSVVSVTFFKTCYICSKIRELKNIHVGCDINEGTYVRLLVTLT